MLAPLALQHPLLAHLQISIKGGKQLNKDTITSVWLEIQQNSNNMVVERDLENKDINKKEIAS